MFKLINRKKGVSRSPEEWLKYANARFNEYNVLQPWEDAQKNEMNKKKPIENEDNTEKPIEDKSSSKNEKENKSDPKSLDQEATCAENSSSTDSNDHQDHKKEKSCEEKQEKSFLTGINRNLATFIFSSLFMLSVITE
ncbi:uncharacterized protein SOCG_06264 [Schizosaccharomyces octosporus yFS286]|uniref:Uncharacterized protein n=1 Tax=Schizosaccharomyces octosporus (strain yFS286) TaxID=483514 RepID=S9R4I8_SCHOY|nr:uncharacterized protein SOCG_06264 [Schizosaccharomyces octosporus yFS286]EPX73265.1 hypothetical protein SOCG_06264 [Schizosaccharomyces octosporus yFS286]